MTCYLLLIHNKQNNLGPPVTCYLSHALVTLKSPVPCTSVAVLPSGDTFLPAPAVAALLNASDSEDSHSPMPPRLVSSSETPETENVGSTRVEVSSLGTGHPTTHWWQGRGHRPVVNNKGGGHGHTDCKVTYQAFFRY